MKKLTFHGISLIIMIALGFLYAFSEAGPTSINKDSGTTLTTLDPPASPLVGGWLLIWGKYGDNIRNPEEPYQFKMFTDKHYSLLMDQGEGNWVGAAGTYVLEDNIYKETVKYATLPEYVGFTLWWTYEIKNDTLWMTGPEKVFDKDGNEAPDAMGGYGHMKEARVRAK